ncbi:hypothetical protein ACLOJK_036566, partial [Asimina triloba]
GGFAINDYRSFDPAVPHQFILVLTSMAQQTYNYVDYCPMAITLAAEGNWPMLVAAASSAPSPAHKVLISNPRSFHKTISAMTALSATRPSHRAATIAAVSSAPRPLHKAATSISWSTRKTASKDQEKIKEGWPGLRRTTRLNRQDAQPLPLGPHHGTSHSGSRHSRRAPTTAPKKKIMVAVKQGDLPPGWCHPPHRHNTYPRLVTDYWVQVRTPNKFGPLIRLSKAQAQDLEDRGTFSPILHPTEFPRRPHPRRERRRQRSQMATANVNVVTTRLAAAAMPTLPSSCSLSHPYGHCQLAFSDSSTVASYMVGEEEPEQLSPQATHQKILELEAELRRMRDVMNSFEATGITPPQGVRRSLHPTREHAASQEAGPSASPQEGLPQVQVDPNIFTSTLHQIKMSEPISPRIWESAPEVLPRPDDIAR